MSPIPLNNNNFEQVEPGNYPARLFGIDDGGTQENNFSGKTTTSRKVLVTFELVGEHMADGRPFVISRAYTASLHEKSALRRDLESKSGRPFPKDAEKTFNLKSLLGEPVMVTVAETESGKRKIAGLAPVPKGMTVPPAENPERYFSLDAAEFSEESLAKVPDWWREKILEGPEYKLLTETRNVQQPQQPLSEGAATDEEFPWD